MPVSDVLLDEIERVRRHGFVAAELERTKTEYARFLEQAVAAQATIAGTAIASALANHFVTGNVVTAPELQKTLGTRYLAEASSGRRERGHDGVAGRQRAAAHGERRVAGCLAGQAHAPGVARGSEGA